MSTLCLLEVSQLRTKAVDGRGALQKNKNKKVNISSSHADVCRAISTKFCMVIEVVRAIILGFKLFWVRSIILPLGVVENDTLTDKTKLAYLDRLTNSW